jgi:hypothetical protein
VMHRYNLLALYSNQVANPAWNLALSNQATPFIGGKMPICGGR